eukprot:477707-Pleurochrysis_carterae.AAC.2
MQLTTRSAQHWAGCPTRDCAGVRSVRNAAEAGTDPAARDAGSDADGVSADDAALWANLEQHMQASAAISSLPIDSAAHIADRVQQARRDASMRAGTHRPDSARILIESACTWLIVCARALAQPPFALTAAPASGDK